MRFQWFSFGLGMMLLTAPAQAERDQNYNKYRNGNITTNFTAAPTRSARKKIRREPIEVASRSQDDAVFARPTPAELPPVSLRQLPQLEQGNLPYMPEKLELLRALKFEEARPDEAVAGAIYDALLGKAGPIRVTASERQAIVAHYRTSGFKPLWIEASGISERAKKLEAVFAAAEQEGLEPDEFLLTAADPSDSLSLAQFELKMTAATLKYARQASGGRLLPNRLSTYNDIKPQRVKPEESLRILAYSPFPADYLMRLHPSHPAYAVFKVALAELRKAPSWDGEPIAGGPRIKPGQINFRIPLVRERLARLGFLPGELSREQLLAQGLPQHVAVNAAYDSASELLDSRLALALKAFQKQKNLKATGALDIPTVKALNTHSEKQDMLRLIANMERLRWLPKSLGERYLIVNQAAFELRVVDKGEVIWRTPVVVGKPETQTSAFHDQLETVVFNPPWGVPPSIVTNEMLPILWRDPSYLDRQGFKVYDQTGKVVKSRSINWAQYGDNPPFSIQQPPGDDNALGELKFLFPNSHAIYMHDTPSKSLFSKPVRTFSHGCVRVENPRELARIVLGMSPEKIAFHIASGLSETVPVPRKLPVHLTYFTAWPGDNGKVNYYADIYGRDAAMTEVFTVLKVALR
jgi:murein L,D-transpeptidase YcbB/YkuD